MLQRLIAAVLGVLGLIAIALGIASATAWRADDTLTARAQAADGSTLVTTAPGVLELGDAPVTVRVTADDGAKVVVAVGRDTDVAGWVGDDAHTVVTGLSDWHTLATDAVAAPEADAAPADPAAAPPVAAPDPDGSDLWVLQATGEGTAELTWTPPEGRWTALAASVGDGAAAPVVELSWPQTVTTPWLLPGVVGGAVLLVLALLLALRGRRAGRAGDGTWHPVVTGATPVVGAANDAPTVVLTRRELREAGATPSRPTPTVASRLRGLATGETPAVASRPPGPATGATPTVDTARPAGGTPPADAAPPADTAPRAGAASPVGSASAMGSASPVGSATGETPRAGASSSSGGPGSGPADGAGAGAPDSTRPGTAPAGPAARAGTAPPQRGPVGAPGDAAGAPAGASTGASSPPPAPTGRAPGTGAVPSVPGAPGPEDGGTTPAGGGSRADAWRRAWGFPGAGTGDTPTPPRSRTSDDSDGDDA